MIFIVGLGNPGKKYENTRHNVGFAVVKAFLRELTPVKKTIWREDRKANSLVAKVDDLVLVQPQTMMNASGFAVVKLTKRYSLDINQLWVVHDDLDLPLGKIRIKKGGGTAGHRGIDSIVKELGTNDFVRFRLGIGRPRKNLKVKTQNQKLIEDYVLLPFRSGEKDKARKMVKRAVEAIRIALEKGLKTAMDQFNP